MLEISRRDDSAGGTYHLSNPVPTENNFWLPNICRILHVEGIPASWRDFFRKDAYDQAGSALPKANGVLLPVFTRRASFRLPPGARCAEEHRDSMSPGDSGIHLQNDGMVCRVSRGSSGSRRLLLPIRAGFDVILLPLACIEWLSWTITPTIV